VSAEDDIDALEESMFGQRAKEFFEFKVYGAQHNHIVTLRLRRQEGMTIGDMGQLQNFLWTQIGYAIRDNKELQQTLRHGGVEVLLDDPSPPEAASDAN
jgi:hypothetical protein